ncbi:hypothetical protein HY933_02885 [Candidatus Falkowbacteria bacterium]|nr:hypothetical protein [Candidatus Falkowbacteria bacterium]
MEKFTKKLLKVAIIIAVASILAAVYIRLTTPPAQPLTNQPNLTEVPRAELYDNYFKKLELSATTLTPTDQPQVTWQLTDTARAGTQYSLKVLDTAKEIFISETAPMNLAEFSGSAFGNPGTPGQYELWVYLMETDNIQALVATLPFSVK